MRSARFIPFIAICCGGALPIIREAQKAGATTLRQIAEALNARGVATARGGQWHVDRPPLLTYALMLPPRAAGFSTHPFRTTSATRMTRLPGSPAGVTDQDVPVQDRRSRWVYLTSGAGGPAENARWNVARSALGRSETAM
jgi:hypothetical protein